VERAKTKNGPSCTRKTGRCVYRSFQDPHRHHGDPRSLTSNPLYECDTSFHQLLARRQAGEHQLLACQPQELRLLEHQQRELHFLLACPFVFERIPRHPMNFSVRSKRSLPFCPSHILKSTLWQSFPSQTKP